MNLLFVLHNWVGYAPYGGTELHVKHLVETFRQYTTHHIYVLFPKFKDNSEVISTYVIRDINNNIETIHSLSYPVTRECYRHQEWSDIVSCIIVKYKIDLVHFFHLIGYPLSFPIVAQQAGAKVVISFFDYFMVCPHPNLLKEGNQFCGYPNVSLETCDLCLKRTFQYEFGVQRNRRHLISEILYHADGVHYLCNEQKARIIAAYSHLTNRPNLTIGLGLDRHYINSNEDILLSTKEKSLLLFSVTKMPLKVACIGNFISNKGADLLLQIMDYYQAKFPLKLQFQVYGTPHPLYEQALLQMSNKGVIVHGGYSPEQLPQLLKGCDIALFASTWPETFVLALSEVWFCGLVPVAPNIGAFGERITHGKNGFLYNLDDPGSLIQTLDDLVENRHKLDDCLHQISLIKYLSLQDNLNAYQSLYNQICQADTNPNHSPQVSRIILNARPETWGKFVNPLPVVLDIPIGRKIIRKVWNYYQRKGLTKTIARSFDYLFFKIQHILKS